MPNWCNNVVTIQHSDEKKLRKLFEAAENNQLCGAVIPVPKGFLEYNNIDDMPDEEKQFHLAEFGADNWYDFCVSKWGTKWDISDCDATLKLSELDGNTLTLNFLTAWSPPIGIYEALVNDGFQVDAMYFESGMGFAGTYNNENGESFYDDMQFVPPELDECFSITECYAEHDEEEEQQ